MSTPATQTAPVLDQLLDQFRVRIQLAINDDTYTKSFDDFAAFIQHRDTLKPAFELLKASKEAGFLQNPSARLLLAAFMMHFFPEEVLGRDARSSDADEHDKHVFEASGLVVNNLFPEEGADAVTIQQVLSSIAHFQQQFEEWRDFDKERMLKELTMAHQQWTMSLHYLEDSLEGSRDPESVQAMIEQVRSSMLHNEQRIKQIGGQEAFNRVQDIVSNPIRIDLDQLISEVGAERYWEEFSEQLRASPPNFGRVIELLGEIRQRLKALIPDRRAELRVAVDASIDVDFIRQMIHFGSFDGPMFWRVFEAIWNRIKNLQSASMDAEWDDFRESVEREISSGSPSSWDSLLPRVFNRFLVQIDRIEDAAKAFREQLEAMRLAQQAEHLPENEQPADEHADGATLGSAK